MALDFLSPKGPANSLLAKVQSLLKSANTVGKKKKKKKEEDAKKLKIVCFLDMGLSAVHIINN